MTLIPVYISIPVKMVFMNQNYLSNEAISTESLEFSGNKQFCTERTIGDGD